MSCAVTQHVPISLDGPESLYQVESSQLPYKLYSWLDKKIVPATDRLEVALTALSKDPSLSIELHDLRPLLKSLSHLIDELTSQGFDNTQKLKQILRFIAAHKWTISSDSEATKRFLLTPFHTLSDEIVELSSKIARHVPQKKDPAGNAKARLLRAYQNGKYHKIISVSSLRASTLSRTNTQGNISRLVTEMQRLSLCDTKK